MTAIPSIARGGSPHEQPPRSHAPRRAGTAVYTRTDTVARSYRITAYHNGVQKDPLVPPLTRLWTKSFGGTKNTLIAGGRVFVVTVTGTDTAVYAFAAATGETLWRRVYGPGDQVSMGYDDGRLFVTDNAYQRDRFVLTALVAASGKPIWHRYVKTNPRLFLFPPTARYGRVYVGLGSSGSRVNVFDEATGHLLWSNINPSGAFPEATVAKQVVYIAYPCDEEFALAQATGDVLWHNGVSCSGGGQPTAALYAGRLFVNEYWGQGKVFEASSGRVIGNYLTSAGAMPTFWHDLRIMTRSSGGITRTVVAETLDGSFRWRFDETERQFSAPPIVDGDYVYVGTDVTEPARVYALSAATGRLVWQDVMDSKVLELSAGGGLVVANTEHGMVVYA